MALVSRVGDWKLTPFSSAELLLDSIGPMHGHFQQLLDAAKTFNWK
ncbi:MAG: hypothetical protein KBG11_05535 [Bacteroidia bacterium]|nr:hypothetical protein [Bacteroidia bacterium]